MTREPDSFDVVGDNLVLRRKRALYRAQHRGTKELDWMLGRYAETKLSDMGAADLTTFEAFLQAADPEINAWLLEPSLCSEVKFSSLIAGIRSFNSIV